MARMSKVRKKTGKAATSTHRRGHSSAARRAGSQQAGPSVDLSRLELHSVRDRKHISQVDAFARLPEPGASFADWLESLPDFLGVKRLRSAVDAIVVARRADMPVAMAMGGHVVKVGCGPVLIDLMRRGAVTAVACHGATAIHDFEIALTGATSEDVADTIRDGRFGMVEETMAFFAEAARSASRRKIGFGESVGELIHKRRLPHAEFSVLANAVKFGLPATVHVAVGTDTVHMSPKMDGAALGAATMHDFRTLCGVVAAMGKRGRGGCGVWCNIGSAVIMPEVFLKALAVARNLGADLDALTTINLDMLRHYRPTQNVVGRPVAPGRGLDLAGHHEILLPMLRQAIIEKMA